MATLLEFECRAPVDGYRIMSFDERKFGAMSIDERMRSDDFSVLATADATEDERYLLRRWGMRIVPYSGLVLPEPEVRQLLEPQSGQIRCFDLFEVTPSPFLEFVNNAPERPKALADLRPRSRRAPTAKRKALADLIGRPLFDVEPQYVDAAKALANRFGPLLGGEGPEYVDTWYYAMMEMRRAVTAWEKAKTTGDFGPIIQSISRLTRPIGANILLREDPANGAARLCLRPPTLLDALWTQLALALDGSEYLRTCVECKKWFTISAGQGRSDKEYCTNACRMRAYRERKGKH